MSSLRRTKCMTSSFFSVWINHIDDMSTSSMMCMNVRLCQFDLLRNGYCGSLLVLGFGRRWTTDVPKKEMETGRDRPNQRMSDVVPVTIIKMDIRDGKQ